jgi:hypothetical protein
MTRTRRLRCLYSLKGRIGRSIVYNPRLEYRVSSPLHHVGLFVRGCKRGSGRQICYGDIVGLAAAVFILYGLNRFDGTVFAAPRLADRTPGVY